MADANCFGVLIFFETLNFFKSLYTSLKLSIFGPCKIFAPNLAASSGFCPPLE